MNEPLKKDPDPKQQLEWCAMIFDGQGRRSERDAVFAGIAAIKHLQAELAKDRDAYYKSFRLTVQLQGTLAEAVKFCDETMHSNEMLMSNPPKNAAIYRLRYTVLAGKGIDCMEQYRNDSLGART